MLAAHRENWGSGFTRTQRCTRLRKSRWMHLHRPRSLGSTALCVLPLRSSFESSADPSRIADCRRRRLNDWTRKGDCSSFGNGNQANHDSYDL